MALAFGWSAVPIQTPSILRPLVAAVALVLATGSVRAERARSTAPSTRPVPRGSAATPARGPRLRLADHAVVREPAPIARTPRIVGLPSGARFEGGDLLPLPAPRPKTARPATPLARGVVLRTVEDARRANIQAGSAAPIYFLGHGFRTSADVAQHLADELGAIVVAGELSDPRYFHADTALGVFPDGVTLYRGGFKDATRELLEYLYPDRVHEVSEAEARKMATNGRIVRLGATSHGGRRIERYGYFYTEGAFRPGFFEELRARYPRSTLTVRPVHERGVTFEVHELRYQLDGVEKRITYVPMPTTQAVLGAGSSSCLTLLKPDGKTVVMVPPTHFDLSAGLNPAEDQALLASGGVDRKLAMIEYGHQKARFERFGVAVEELAPTAGLSEQIYTRDTGYFFRTDAGGRGWDSVFAPATKTTPAFMPGTLNHAVRLGEVAAMRRGLALER
jgi:N-dimethylarginine dimethylaminohydrolase